MPSCPVGTAEVAYEVQGKGDPVVLVHATAGNRMHWLQQTPVLAERWQVVTPEYAGGGETVDDGGELDVDTLAAQVLGVADHLGLDRFHLAGWSLGSVVSAVVAATEPGRVRSVALVSTWGRSDARLRFQFDFWARLYEADRDLFSRLMLTDGFTPEWFETVAEGVEGMVALTAASLAAGAARHARLDGRVDIEDRLATISSPAMVIAGVEDRVVPITCQRAAAERIPGARLVELPCGHMIPIERGPELAGLLADFFGAH